MMRNFSTEENFSAAAESSRRSKMQDGFQLLPVLIGLFAISQIFEEAEEGMRLGIFQLRRISAPRRKAAG